MPQEPAGEPRTVSPGPATQRFIPFRRSDLVDMLDEDGRLAHAERDGFRAFVQLLNAVFHHEFHSRLEALKDAYAPFNPDPDTRAVRRYDGEDREAARRRLVAGLRELLDHGNFEPISDQDLQTAFEEESLLDLHLAVDRSDFEDVLFFRRGVTVREEELTSWLGLRRRTVVFTNYEKVLMLVTFKDAEHFTDQDPDELPFTPGSTILKLFQDVPRADLEMLFPNAEPRMRRVDKLLIGVPALVSGIVVLATKLLTTLGLLLLLAGFWLGVRDEPVELDQATLVTLGAGLGSLGGYLTRQFNKFKKRKMEFMKTLSDNLYFRNLDNDTGVLHHLIDDAEEEEAKEALLGWYFLRIADAPLAPGQLDEAIEAWFRNQQDLAMDFEVHDGIDKLKELRLLEDVDGGRLAEVPMDEAMRRLDERWDRYFQYDRPLRDRSG
ncbi:MAG TPA: TMEM143 family protein [Egibacteraceae bacterium]|nr:TMEM143 family protein [Egibacteraceae bacterium]